MPLDGKIVWGVAGLSLQHISGESRPLRMAPGAMVPAGSLNTDGVLVLEVAATTDDSTPARMARLAAEAQVGCWGLTLRAAAACVAVLRFNFMLLHFSLKRFRSSLIMGLKSQRITPFCKGLPRRKRPTGRS